MNKKVRDKKNATYFKPKSRLRKGVTTLVSPKRAILTPTEKPIQKTVVIGRNFVIPLGKDKEVGGGSKFWATTVF